MKRGKKDKIAIRAQIRQKATKIPIQILKLNKFKLGLTKKDKKLQKLENKRPKIAKAHLQVPTLNLNNQTIALMTANSQFLRDLMGKFTAKGWQICKKK